MVEIKAKKQMKTVLKLLGIGLFGIVTVAIALVIWPFVIGQVILKQK